MRRGLVYQKGVLAGRLVENDDGQYIFSYEKEYLKNGADAVSLSLPLRESPYVADRLFGFFDGLIPEGWLLEIITHNFAIKARDRMGLLLVSCEDAIGSVSVVDALEGVLPTAPSGQRHRLSSSSVKRREKALIESNIISQGTCCLVCTGKLLHGENQYHARCSKVLFGRDFSASATETLLDFDLNDVEAMAMANINQRLAVTGAQRKISLSLSAPNQPQRLTVKTKDGLFILKPPPPEFPDFPLIEHASMLIAASLGLKTAIMGLVRFASGQYGYITRRFDRQVADNHSGTLVKISMEDFGQIFDRNIEAEKYRGSYNQIAKWLKAHATIPGESAIRFFSLVFLSYLIGNNDLHLKNVAVLTDDKISLSPVYDLVSTQLIDDEPQVDLTLQLNGHTKKITRDDWLTLAADLGLVRGSAEKLLAEFAGSIDRINAVIASSFLPDPMKIKLQKLISDRMKRAVEI